ncbi:hypothetical protein JOE65_000680 [Arthrobacter roseus]|nr:hypothetical protein [Arthrobacter roseus]
MGKKLLELTAEYIALRDNAGTYPDLISGEESAVRLDAIAEEYEQAIRQLLGK